MDIIKKTQEILNNKIELKEEQSEEVKYFIVYLIHKDDIVYIGKTSNILEYVGERKDKYSATHYSYEELNIDEIDNYLAQLILEIQPIYTNRVPNNTKYISHNVAKRDYFIYKADFRKVYNEYGGYKFKNSLYIEKRIFNDIFAQLPYHENIPKVGSKVLLVEDYKMAQINQWGGSVRDILYDKEGNEVEAYRDYIPDYKEEYRNLKFLEEKEYEVTNLLDSNTFEAINYNDRNRIILNANAKSNTLGSYEPNECYKDIWINAIDDYNATIIKNYYLELLEKEKIDE